MWNHMFQENFWNLQFSHEVFSNYHSSRREWKHINRDDILFERERERLVTHNLLNPTCRTRNDRSPRGLFHLSKTPCKLHFVFAAASSERPSDGFPSVFYPFHLPLVNCKPKHTQGTSLLFRWGWFYFLDWFLLCPPSHIEKSKLHSPAELTLLQVSLCSTSYSLLGDLCVLQQQWPRSLFICLACLCWSSSSNTWRAAANVYI